jgi:hypothetical protein
MTMIRLYGDERDTLEDEFVTGALDRACAPASERTAFSAKCFADAGNAEARWLERVLEAKVQRRPNRLYVAAWRLRNRQAKMPT